MNKLSNEDFETALGMVLIVVAMIVANIVQIIGPALAAFAISYNKYESDWDANYGLTEKKTIQSLLLGEIIFLIIIIWFLSPLFYFFNLFTLWPLLLSGLIINSALVVVGYSIGKKYYFKNLEKEAQQMS